jgi:hypothetical protein
MISRVNLRFGGVAAFVNCPSKNVPVPIMRDVNLLDLRAVACAKTKHAWLVEHDVGEIRTEFSPQ